MYRLPPSLVVILESPMLIDLIRFFGFKFSKNPFLPALIFFYGFRPHSLNNTTTQHNSNTNTSAIE